MMNLCVKQDVFKQLGVILGQNDEICNTNDEICIKNDEICITKRRWSTRTCWAV